MDYPLLTVLLAGFVGTTALIAALYAIQWPQIKQGDMVRAVGSMLTRSKKKSLPVGLAVIYFGGFLFAFGYAALVGILPVAGVASTFLLGAGLGTAHGVVIGLLLVAAFETEHPLIRFMPGGAGITMVMSYTAIHAVYGAIVGAVLSTIADHTRYFPVFFR